MGVITCVGSQFEEGGRAQRWLGLGVIIALLWGARTSLVSAGAAALGQPSAGPGAVALWICDRDASALIGLDADGLRRARIEVPFPVELEPGADGALWVLYQLGPGPSAGRRLCSISVEGRVRVDLPARGLGGLVACGQGAVAGVLQRGAVANLVRFDRAGARLELGAIESDAYLACGEDGRLWLAGPSLLSQAGESPHIIRELPSVPTRITTAWSSQGAWMLERSARDELRLVRLDGAGQALFEVPAADLRLGSGPVLLAGEAGLGVWLVTERGEALHLDDDGEFVARGSLPMLGVEAISTSLGGGLLAVSGGSLMRLDPQALSLPGQGGFRYACDLISIDTTR